MDYDYDYDIDVMDEMDEIEELVEQYLSDHDDEEDEEEAEDDPVPPHPVDLGIVSVQHWINGKYGMGICVTGVYDDDTKTALCAISKQEKAGDLCLNSTGDAVNCVQALLICKRRWNSGFSPLFDDALLGTLERYQLDHGIPITGKLDEATLKSLVS